MPRKPVTIQKQGPLPADEHGRRKMKEVDDMLKSAAYRKVVKEGQTNPKIKAEFKAAPKDFLRRKGVRIPEGAEISFREGGPADKKGAWELHPKERHREKEIDDIMNSDAVQEIFQEISSDASVESEFKTNLQGLLERKGIRIPEGVKVEYREGSHCFWITFASWACNSLIGWLIAWYVCIPITAGYWYCEYEDYIAGS